MLKENYQNKNSIPSKLSLKNDRETKTSQKIKTEEACCYTCNALQEIIKEVPAEIKEQ